MKKVFLEIVSLLKETFRQWQVDGANREAAALAYYAAFSLAPILVILISVGGFLLERDAVRSLVLAEVEPYLGEQGRELLSGMITSIADPEASLTASILGGITVIIGALGVFRALKASLNHIWHIRPKPEGGFFSRIRSLLVDQLLAFVLLLGIGLLFILTLLASSTLSVIVEFSPEWLPGSGLLLRGLNFILFTGITTVLLALVYKVFPDAEVEWRDVWLGAGFTALLFGLSRYVIGLYLGSTSVGSVFGAAGSLALILVWIYYSAIILFLGAEFTQVYSNRYGSKIRSASDSVRFRRELIEEVNSEQTGARPSAP